MNEVKPIEVYERSREAMSTGERRIAEVLDDMDVEYVAERQLHGFPGKFDFIILSHHAIIEFDGEQHFEPIDTFGGWDYLYRTQHDDDLRYIFCKKMGIRMLRIPYTHYDRIEPLVKKFIERREIDAGFRKYEYDSD